MRVKDVRRSILAGTACGMLALSPVGADAQTTIAPLVAGDDPEYRIDPLTIGAVRLSPQVLATATYDDNVIASPDGSEVEDLEFIVRPEMAARIGDDTLLFELEGFGEFSRFADFITEDSDTYGVRGVAAYSPNVGTRLTGDVGYARQKENRGDPEARDLAGPGPRLFDNIYANADFSRTGGRVLLALEGAFSDIDAISPLDDDRDFKTYAGSATIGYRVSGPVYATLTGFTNYRDFRLERTLLEPDRDATTYGAQLGLSFAESERLRGRARFGFFRFDPSDPGLDPRTGFSANVSLIYLPTRRTALILEAFNGDVATFRSGAQARTDTSVSLTGQVEMRHNFYGRAGVSYTRNRFIGTGIEERILRADAALEYLVNRRLSFIAQALVADRSSDDPTQVFDRLSVSVGARLRL
ncbi:outer membrane beta-barrel protein [Erythrobacter sp.]|jgi:hypothetical protein|uniref:outer membrane beta-barrel protein n=1 Tax=Erythrobacter sp. TaxID=1042 RepID=UPI002EBB1133|nr:outer membrane beta-barrel protein [Erythrobacter sp.]